MTTKIYFNKKRKVKKAILFYVEGKNEEAFLKYLKYLYSSNSNLAITIKSGHGGSADFILRKAIRYQGAFDTRIVVLDIDKSKSEIQKAQNIANDEHIILIKNSPCLEATLLSILRDSKNFEGKPSKWCKKEFEKKYISQAKRNERSEYEKKFPRELLNKRRKCVLILNMLISIICGDNIN